jgi:hypothetical protein
VLVFDGFFDSHLSNMLFVCSLLRAKLAKGVISVVFCGALFQSFVCQKTAGVEEKEI